MLHSLLNDKWVAKYLYIYLDMANINTLRKSIGVAYIPSRVVFRVVPVGVSGLQGPVHRHTAEEEQH